jgi:prevent-host-death family protein
VDPHACPEVQETVVAEVGVAQLRRELNEWLERARSGEEVVITERGRPVARLSGIDVAFLDRLTEESIISGPPRMPRPSARGRQRAAPTSGMADLVMAARQDRR